MSQEINIRITGKDDASAPIAGAMQKITASTNSAAESTKKASLSAKDAVIGFSGLAVSAFALYSAFDRYSDAGVAVDRANLNAKRSAENLDQAQKNLNAAIAKYGVSSVEAIDAADKLSIAQEALSVAEDRAKMIQDNQNESLMQFGLMIVPTAITAVDSLNKLYGQWTIHAKNAAAAQKALNAESAASAGTGLAGSLGAAGIGLAVVAGAAMLTKQRIDEVTAATGQAVPVWQQFIDYVTLAGARFAITSTIMKTLGSESTETLEGMTRLFKEAKVPLDDVVEIMSTMGYSKEAIDSVVASMMGFSAVVAPIEAVSASIAGLTVSTNALSNSLADISFSQVSSVNTENARYQKMLDGISDYWNKALGITETEQQKIVDQITANYSKETNAVTSHYRTLLNEANAYYDELQDAADSGLNALKASRDKDRDSAEGRMLIEKVKLEALYASGAMDKEQFERKKATLAKKYSDETAGITDNYRLKELNLEASNAVDSAKIAEDRKQALADLAAAEAKAKLEVSVRGEQEKNDAVILYQKQLEEATYAHQQNLLLMEIAGETARIQAALAFSRQMHEILSLTMPTATTGFESGAKANVETSSIGATSSISDALAISKRLRDILSGARTGHNIPAYASGIEGITTGPMLALLGENGPERVSIQPLNKSNSLDNSPTINAKIENHVSIQNVSGTASLPDILAQITRAINNGTANGLTEALSRAQGEKRRRRI